MSFVAIVQTVTTVMRSRKFTVFYVFFSACTAPTRKGFSGAGVDSTKYDKILLREPESSFSPSSVRCELRAVSFLKEEGIVTEMM